MQARGRKKGLEDSISDAGIYTALIRSTHDPHIDLPGGKAGAVVRGISRDIGNGAAYSIHSLSMVFLMWLGLPGAT